MKKTVIGIAALAGILLFVLTGCGTQTEANAAVTPDTSSVAGEYTAETGPGNTGKTSQEEENQSVPEEEGALEGRTFEWPSVATDLGVPELGKGKITSVVITEAKKGKKIIVGYSGIKAQDIDTYNAGIGKSDFQPTDKYGMEGIWNYEKSANGGKVGIQVMHSNEDATIMITSNSTVGDASGGLSNSGSWSDRMPKEVPEFKKGTLSGTSELSGMVVLEYENVSQADADAYGKELADNGFSLDDGMYLKMDSNAGTGVMVKMEFVNGKLTIGAAGM